MVTPAPLFPTEPLGMKSVMVGVVAELATETAVTATGVVIGCCTMVKFVAFGVPVNVVPAGSVSVILVPTCRAAVGLKETNAAVALVGTAVPTTAPLA